MRALVLILYLIASIDGYTLINHRLKPCQIYLNPRKIYEGIFENSPSQPIVNITLLLEIFEEREDRREALRLNMENKRFDKIYLLICIQTFIATFALLLISVLFYVAKSAPEQGIVVFNEGIKQLKPMLKDILNVTKIGLYLIVSYMFQKPFFWLINFLKTLLRRRFN
jgi:hypothetical protein